MAHPSDCGNQIVREIIADLTDRRGLRQVWVSLDADIKQEIIEAWVKIAIDHLDRHKNT